MIPVDPTPLLTAAVRIDWTHAVLARVHPGFGFHLRAEPDHIIWCCTDGRCAVATASGNHELRAGSWLWSPPGCRWSAGIPSRHRPMLAYSIRFRVTVERVPWTFAGPPIVRHDDDHARELCARLFDECCLDSPQRDDCARAALHLLAVHAGREDPAHDRSRLGRAQRHLLQHRLDRSHGHWPEPADLVRWLGLSPSQLMRRFRNTYGCPPRSWLLQERLRRAAYLLQQDHRTIGAIAVQLGYTDSNLFARQFRARYGCSPTAWRGR